LKPAKQPLQKWKKRGILSQIAEIHYQGEAVLNMTLKNFQRKMFIRCRGTLADEIVSANKDIEWVSLEIDIINVI
jgi:hypothetical protein